MSNSCAALIAPCRDKNGAFHYVLEIETIACIHVFDYSHNREGFNNVFKRIQQFKNTDKTFVARVLSTKTSDIVYTYDNTQTLR